MTFLDKLEKRIGFIEVGNLPLYVVSSTALVWLAGQMDISLLAYLIFDPLLIIKGEVWRLVSFLFVPPQNLFSAQFTGGTFALLKDTLFCVFYLMFFYYCSTSLERHWGSFGYTLYFLIGVMGTGGLAFLFYFINIPVGVGTFYLYVSLFLAFARLFPEDTFYMIPIPIPIKMKWLAWVLWAWVILNLALVPFYYKVTILGSLLNYFLFFGKSHWDSMKATLRRADFERKINKDE